MSDEAHGLRGVAVERQLQQAYHFLLSRIVQELVVVPFNVQFLQLHDFASVGRTENRLPRALGADVPDLHFVFVIYRQQQVLLAVGLGVPDEFSGHRLLLDLEHACYRKPCLRRPVDVVLKQPLVSSHREEPELHLLLVLLVKRLSKGD